MCCNNISSDFTFYFIYLHFVVLFYHIKSPKKYKFILHIILYALCLSLFGVPSVVLEPDVGMPEKDAHRFFKQLIAAVVSKFRL